MADKALPLYIKKRLEISKLFYPLSRNEERKLARIFRNGMSTLQINLEPKARELDFIQEVMDHSSIIWKDSNSKICECLFCLIDDAADFSNIKSIINKIENLDPIFTYAIIHQKKDGEGTYDIFRLSKFSYLEHCNRVKIPKAHRKNNLADNK